MYANQKLMLRLVVSLLMLTLITACSHDASPLENASEDNAFVITFAGDEDDRTFYLSLITEFEQLYPEITVQFVSIPDYIYQNISDLELFYRQLASLADVVILNSTPPISIQTYFKDIQPLLEVSSEFDAADYWPGVLNACQNKDGYLWGIPMNIEFQGIFFDQEAFNSVVLPYPEPGWTWDQFGTAAQTLSINQAGRIRYGIAERNSTIISSEVAQQIEASQGEVNVQAIQLQIQWYFDLLESNSAYVLSEGQSQNESAGESWDYLLRSEYPPAMWTGNLAEAKGLFGDLFDMSTTYGFVPYPVSANQQNIFTSPAWTDCAVISSGSKYPFQAWAWLKFLSHQRLVNPQSDDWELLQVPARISVTDNSDYWENIPDDFEPSIRYLLEHAWYGTDYPEALVAVQRALSIVANDQQNFSEALNQTTAEIERSPTITPDVNLIVVATPKPTQSDEYEQIVYFYSAYGKERSALERIVASYNQAQSTVKVILVTDLNLPESADRLSEFSRNFDCFTSIPFDWESQYLDNLLSLNTLIENEDRQFVDDFDPVLMEIFKYQGDIYGVPAFADVPVMVYNLNLLEKRGLQAPEMDWTFDDFIEMINIATNNTEADRSYGFLLNPMDDFLLAGFGGTWADFYADTPVPLFNSPEFASALDWLDQLNKTGIILPGKDYSISQQAILSGEVAFWITQLEDPAGWLLDQDIPFQMGVAPLPSMESNASIFNWGVQGHFISSNAANPNYCWDWIKYLSEQAEIFQGIPARNSVNQSSDWETIVGEEKASVYRQSLFNTMRSHPQSLRFNPVSWPIYQWEQQAIDAVLQDEAYLIMLPALQSKAEEYVLCIEQADRTNLLEFQYNDLIQNCVSEVESNGG